jgi:PAS domain-containing protein
LDESGNLVSVLSHALDVSDRERAVAALRDREERLRAALWASRTGTYRWDIRADILDWDDNLHWLFGLPEGTTVSRVEEFVELIYSDDREAVALAVERSIHSRAWILTRNSASLGLMVIHVGYWIKERQSSMNEATPCK